MLLFFFVPLTALPLETQPHLSPQIPLQDLLSREDLDSIAKEAGEATGEQKQEEKKKRSREKRFARL